MELEVVDYVLLCVMAAITLIGLFRGLSGELGSIAGFGAARLAGWLLYGAAHGCAVSVGLAQRGGALETGSTAVIDFVFAIIAFGIVRWMVAKFVSCLVPQPTNALLGGLGGVFKCCVLLAFLMGAGFVRPGEYASSFVPQYSKIVAMVATMADSWFGGAR